MKNDKISKSYLAILQGELEKNEGTIETYIRRKEKSIILREACECREDAKLAITKYRVLAKNNGLSLVEATPVTGRTHQLRVHFAHIGAQILTEMLLHS
jgi:23S rRNA-/tRNA-specific pseudouridylate synthase